MLLMQFSSDEQMRVSMKRMSFSAEEVLGKRRKAKNPKKDHYNAYANLLIYHHEKQQISGKILEGHVSLRRGHKKLLHLAYCLQRTNSGLFMYFTHFRRSRKVTNFVHWINSSLFSPFDEEDEKIL